MPTYYSLNSRRIRLSEFASRTSWDALPIVFLVKLFGIRFEGSSDEPPVDALTEFECNFDDWPDDVRTFFSDDLEFLRSHGFDVSVAHRIPTPASQTTLFRLTLAAPSGQTMVQLQLRVWINSGKKILVYSRQLSTFLQEGTRLITTTEHRPPGPALSFRISFDIRQPGYEFLRLADVGWDVAWEAHRQRLEGLPPHEIQRVATQSELEEAIDREHADFVDLRLKRGLFEALPQLPDVPEDSPNAAMLAALFKISQKRVTWKSALGSLVLSLAAFVAVAYWQKDSAALIAIIPVLFFHELGHWVAMKAFGYQQTRMLFLPFFGAAVAGRQLNAAGWKKVIVSLMGPLPGIGLGCLLGAVGMFFKEIRLLDVAVTMLALNAFNLLPVLPLDGGQVMQSLLFCRHRFLDLLFRMVAILGAFALGMFTGSYVFMFIGISMCVALKTTYALAKTAEELRRAPDLNTVSPDGISVPVETACRIADELRPKLNSSLSPKFMAAHVMNVFETLNARPPGVLATIGFLGIWFVSLAAGFIASGVFFLARTNNGDFLGVAEMAADRPKFAYLCGTTRSLQPQAAETLRPETLIAQFEKPDVAQARFEMLSNPRTSGRQMLFGSTILIQVPGDAPAVQTGLEATLTAAGATTQVIHPAEAHVRFSAIATSAEKAGELRTQLADYNPLPRFMSLLPPWSAEWRRAPQREAWQRHRGVLLGLIKREIAPPTQESHDLNLELRRAYGRRDLAAAKEIQRKLRDVQQTALKERVEKDRDARVDPLERDLVDAWLAWKLEALERGFENAQDLDWKPGREGRALTAAEMRLRKLGVHLGQETRVPKGQEPETMTGFDRYVYVYNEALIISITLTAFDPIEDLPEIGEWLCAEGCQDVLYEMRRQVDPFAE